MPGVLWPAVVAPREVIVTVVDLKDAAQVQVAERLYTELRAGVKFAVTSRPIFGAA